MWETSIFSNFPQSSRFNFPKILTKFSKFLQISVLNVSLRPASVSGPGNRKTRLPVPRPRKAPFRKRVMIFEQGRCTHIFPRSRSWNHFPKLGNEIFSHIPGVDSCQVPQHIVSCVVPRLTSQIIEIGKSERAGEHGGARAFPKINFSECDPPPTP